VFEQLRSVDVDQAIGMLRVHGRIVTGTNAESVRDGMFGQWWQHRTAGDEASMMARRNAGFDDLKRRARRYVDVAGQLSGEPLIWNERPFQIRDQGHLHEERLRQRDPQRHQRHDHPHRPPRNGGHPVHRGRDCCSGGNEWRTDWATLQHQVMILQWRVWDRAGGSSDTHCPTRAETRARLSLGC